MNLIASSRLFSDTSFWIKSAGQNKFVGLTEAAKNKIKTAKWSKMMKNHKH